MADELELANERLQEIAAELEAPVVVERGEIVALVFTVPGMTLTARARALENAGADEIARFVNLQSNRTVEAMVEGPGLARVVAGAPASSAGRLAWPGCPASTGASRRWRAPSRTAWPGMRRRRA